MPALTQALIYQKTKKADLSAITNLNIWGSKLEDISIMQQIPNIEVLAFSVNEVSDLSPLQNCTNLKELYIRRNKVEDLQELMYLATLPSLHVLLATENPICNDPEYRLWVIKALPQLKKLDEADVTDEERAEAARKAFRVPHSRPGRLAPPVEPAYPSNIKPTQPAQPAVARQQAQPVASYTPQPMPAAQDVNRKIRLAVLNLIDGLDYNSLETIKKQIVALQADLQK